MKLLNINETHLNKALSCQKEGSPTGCILARVAADILGYIPESGVVTFGNVRFTNRELCSKIEDLFDHAQDKPENIEKLRAMLPLELEYELVTNNV